jgi:hypothetical protein
MTRRRPTSWVLAAAACLLALGSAGRALLLPVALAGQIDAMASAQAGGAPIRQDAAVDRDAAAAACRIDVEGGVTSDSGLGCITRRWDNSNDAGPVMTMLFESDSDAATGEPSVRVVISCSGKPPLGLQSWPPPGCSYVKAIVSNEGVEWIGISGIQGTFALTITSVRALRVSGRSAYEVHGVLDSSLPVSNSFAQPTGLRVSF